MMVRLAQAWLATAAVAASFNIALNADVQKRRFALLLHAG